MMYLLFDANVCTLIAVEKCICSQVLMIAHLYHAVMVLASMELTTTHVNVIQVTLVITVK